MDTEYKNFSPIFSIFNKKVHIKGLSLYHSFVGKLGEKQGRQADFLNRIIRLLQQGKEGSKNKRGGYLKRNMKVNHLRNHYSDYVFMFIKKYINEIDKSMYIGDIGAGHLRNLKLFEELGFNNLFAMDREATDNPLKVKLKQFS